MSSFARVVSVSAPDYVQEFWCDPMWKVASITFAEGSVAFGIMYGANIDWVGFAGVFVVVVLIHLPGVVTVFIVLFGYSRVQSAAPTQDHTALKKKMKNGLVCINFLTAVMVAAVALQVPPLTGIAKLDPLEMKIQINSTLPLIFQIFMVWFVVAFALTSQSEPSSPRINTEIEMKNVSVSSPHVNKDDHIISKGSQISFDNNVNHKRWR